MMLNVSEWKRFQIGRLFDIKKGKRLTAEDQIEGYNLYIGAIDSNNGVANHIEQSPIHLGNTISLSYNGSVGEAFYQPEPYWATDDVNALYSKYEGFNEKIGLFLVTVIRKEKYKFSYGRKWTLDNMKITEICLPVLKTSDGQLYIDSKKKYSDEGYIPDWEFMENYIKSLRHKPLTTKNQNGRPASLNTELWKPFITSKLFPILENGKANQQMLEEGNECFYVGAKKDDNGVMLHVKKDDSLITKGNCIVFICNGQGSVGFANYMDSDFIGTTDIVAGYNECLNPLTGLFLATIYSRERPKYSFGRKWKTHLRDTEVNLPVKLNEDGSVFYDDTCKWSDEGYIPDWDFMENYVKALPYGDRV